jgi:DNA-binding beta-propeller fold protein YncE
MSPFALRCAVRVAVAAVAMAASVTVVYGQERQPGVSDCNRPLPSPITRSAARALRLQVTRDGCWIFGARLGPAFGIVVIRRNGDTYEEVRSVATPVNPVNPGFQDLALTRDEKVLVLSSGDQLTFFDTWKLMSGEGDPLLGRIGGKQFRVGFGVAITPDDKYVLAVQWATSVVVMVDLAKARVSGFNEGAVVTSLPASRPIMLAASPDNRFLYATNQATPDVISAPRTCSAGKEPEDVVSVYDLTKAVTNGAAATIGFAFPAGCNPQSLRLSPDGARLYVTAGGEFEDPTIPAAENVLAVFDTRPVLEGKPPTPVARVPVPTLPIAVVDTGKRVVIGFGELLPRNPNPSNLLVIDPSRIASGVNAILGTLPIRGNGLGLMPDGHTVIVNTGTGIAFVDIDRTPIQPVQK